MRKQLFAQVWELVRNQPLLTCISVLGTAFAITMIMVIVIVWQTKYADLAPEVNRSRCLYISAVGVQQKDNKSYGGYSSCSPAFMKRCVEGVPGVEACTAFSPATDALVSLSDGGNRIKADVSNVDPAYWQVFRFDFLSGTGLTEADWGGSRQSVVLCASVARHLFGTTDAVGRSVNIDWQDYTVCGIVADVPTYLADASSRIYVPYTTNAYAYREWGSSDVKVGPAFCLFLMPSHDDLPALKQELEHQVRMMNAPCKKYCFSLREQPTDILGQALKLGNPDVSVEGQRGTLRAICIILALFLIVPALNLSSLIVARMRKRAEEIGVRKAFGASTANLMLQVLVENFVQLNSFRIFKRRASK